MRITNGMITNNTLNSLYNNLNSLNKYYNQMSTGKKIQTVSDDPVIAGKALKLKINVLETQQYQTNVKEAQSWMDITNSSLKNVTAITKTIRDKVLHASTGTLTTEDKQILRKDIGEFWDQIKTEVNATYAGRYVYSGYKTDEPLFTEKSTDLTEDVALGAGSEYVLASDTKLAAGSELAAGSTISVKDAKALEAAGVISASDYTALPSKGEVKLNNAVTVPASGYTLQGGATLNEGSTMKSGTTLPAGSLNPKVYGKVDGHNMNYEIGTGSVMAVNTLGMDKTMNNYLKSMNEMFNTIDAALEDDTITAKDLNELFENKLGEIDALSDDISEKTTDLGSKVSRLNYVTSRLSDNLTNFKSLLSNTEDVDLDETYVGFMQQYSTYTSALQATSKIITNTLADYL